MAENCSVMDVASASVPLPGDCICANFMRRVKRFTVELEKDGEIIWAHTNNTGAMLGLQGPGMEALLSRSANPARKLPFTLERIRQKRGDGHGFWTGVNTSVPNRLFEAAFHARRLDFATGYARLRRERRLGECRLDACLYADGKKPLWVECKNVTLAEDGVAYFPDAPSERGRRHLESLMEIVRAGERAAMFYLIQRPDARCFAPADFIDPLYAELFYQAASAGVEMRAYQALQLPRETALGPALKIPNLNLWRT